ncbi:MAG: rRNA maturation RNase YbeY [Rhodospirillaceae bacterium]|jgi:probable rRNA maturation factor|nr:rRNA maturation RNase YbeY [Rhodospirillaceae bacterium]
MIESISSSIEISVAVLCTNWTESLPAVDDLCRYVVLTAVLTNTDLLPKEFLDKIEISLVLTDDSMIQCLNHKYLGQNKPTNVLSFLYFDRCDNLPINSPLLLGDIILSFETTAREAEIENKSFLDHMSHLLVHGVLHLLGYDHSINSEAEKMENFERIILDDLGIDDPYIM